MFDLTSLNYLYIFKLAHENFNKEAVSLFNDFPLFADVDNEDERDEILYEYLNEDYDTTLSNLLSLFYMDVDIYTIHENEDEDEDDYYDYQQKIDIFCPYYEKYAAFYDALSASEQFNVSSLDNFISYHFDVVDRLIYQVYGCYSTSDLIVDGICKGREFLCEYLPSIESIFKHIFYLTLASKEVLPTLKSICRHYGIKVKNQKGVKK